MKSGFVAIVGRPSVGKSTLLNALCGEKVSIISHTPQTTRVPVRGIVNRSDCQIVFLDTPGYHQSSRKFNSRLLSIVHGSVEAADICLYLTGVERPPGNEEGAVMDLLAKSGKPVVAAINKIDMSCKQLPYVRGAVLVRLQPSALLNISALKKQGLDELMDSIEAHCPEGPALYPLEICTDQSNQFRVSEIIREKAINLVKDELPHSIYVQIEDFEFRPDKDKPASRGKLWIRAALMVESASQAGIMVGKGGSRIATIRTESLGEIRSIFPHKIRLDLRIKVSHKWRHRDDILEKLLG